MLVTLYLAVALAVGTIFGWYARRAYLRIEAWGRAINQRDALLHAVTEEDINHALHRVNVVRFDGAGAPLQAETARAKY